MRLLCVTNIGMVGTLRSGELHGDSAIGRVLVAALALASGERGDRRGEEAVPTLFAPGSICALLVLGGLRVRWRVGSTLADGGRRPAAIAKDGCGIERNWDQGSC